MLLSRRFRIAIGMRELQSYAQLFAIIVIRQSSGMTNFITPL
jgi:hypothetical protein